MRASAVIYVVDLDAMANFYRECFGFQTGDSGADYHLLESDLWTLSLVRVADEIAGTIEISGPARRRADVPVKLAFAVGRIDEVRAKARAIGGRIDPQGSEWEFAGFRHCDGVDPEGNVLQLLEALS